MTRGLDQVKTLLREMLGPPKQVKSQRKREPRTEMLAQTYFTKDGPALFMGGGKKTPITLQGYTVKMRLWDQVVESPERTSSHILRLRQGKVPRITSTPSSPS